MIYIVTSTTTNVPNLSTGPVMGVHGSLKEANAHMSACVNAALTGGKLCWDISSKGGCVAETSEHSVRRRRLDGDRYRRVGHPSSQAGEEGSGAEHGASGSAGHSHWW